MKSLTDLPNIGKILAQKLEQAGIKTEEDLKKIGTFETFLRIKCFDTSACFDMLCAIEGAIQGIRWHSLSNEKKEELKKFFNSLS